MPNHPPRDKNFRAGTRNRSRLRGGKAIAVKDLLQKAGLTSNAIAQRTVKQEIWLNRLAEILPPAQAGHITSATSQRGILTVHADSQSWALRLRYALHEALPQCAALEPGLTAVVVKVVGRR